MTPTHLPGSPGLSGSPQAPLTRLALYQRWLSDNLGLQFATYEDLWAWSVSDLPGFWQSIWDYFEVQSPAPITSVLAESRMPGARWFQGFGGVVMIEAAKQIYAAAPLVRERVKRRLYIAAGGAGSNRTWSD